jgi:hypothetical protein
MPFLSMIDNRFMFQGFSLAIVWGVYQNFEELSDVAKYLLLTAVRCVLS